MLEVQLGQIFLLRWCCRLEVEAVGWVSGEDCLWKIGVLAREVVEHEFSSCIGWGI